MLAKSRRLNIILITIPFLLLIPLVAMQFTTEVNWNLADFIVMGFLLLGFGLLIELVLQKSANMKNRHLYALLVFVLFLLVWAELAVGIFGTPFAGS